MNDEKYLLPTLSTALLAVLFPTYWVTQFIKISNNGGEALYSDLSGLNLGDLLFFVTGLLTVYVYLSLKKLLNERYAFYRADIPLILLAATNALYIFGSLAMELILQMQIFDAQTQHSWQQSVLDINTVTLIVSTVVLGVLDIILGVILFAKAREFSSILQAFAVVVTIQGFFEVTVVFAPITFIVFPLALILLAILFTRKPEMLEVI